MRLTAGKFKKGLDGLSLKDEQSNWAPWTVCTVSIEIWANASTPLG